MLALARVMGADAPGRVGGGRQLRVFGRRDVRGLLHKFPAGRGSAAVDALGARADGKADREGPLDRRRLRPRSSWRATRSRCRSRSLGRPLAGPRASGAGAPAPRGRAGPGPARGIPRRAAADPGDRPACARNPPRHRGLETGGSHGVHDPARPAAGARGSVPLRPDLDDGPLSGLGNTCVPALFRHVLRRADRAGGSLSLKASRSIPRRPVCSSTLFSVRVSRALRPPPAGRLGRAAVAHSAPVSGKVHARRDVRAGGRGGGCRRPLSPPGQRAAIDSRRGRPPGRRRSRRPARSARGRPPGRERGRRVQGSARLRGPAGGSRVRRRGPVVGRDRRRRGTAGVPRPGATPRRARALDRRPALRGPPGCTDGARRHGLPADGLRANDRATRSPRGLPHH